MEELPPLPKQWIGRTLIRSGETKRLILPKGMPGSYIFEDRIPTPYIIVGPGQKTRTYQPNRLCVYVNADNVIQNVAYG
jgi:hypothetical protein